jgi:uncharacterized membrane protein
VNSDEKKKPVLIKKKTKSLMDRFTGLISWFLGSWWAVFFHTLWFTIWLILDFDVNLLTFSVSLEAIFIGIFLLMASNKAEEKRDELESKRRARSRKRIEHDIKLDEKADRQLSEIKHLQKQSRQQMEKLVKEIRKIKRQLEES